MNVSNEKSNAKRKMIAAAVILIVLICSGLALLISKKQEVKVTRRTDIPDYSGITVNRVLKEEIKSGKGRKISVGDEVKVRYHLWIYDPAALGNHGKEITDKDEIVAFEVGRGKVISGWDQALLGMTPGEESILVIPPELAYGDQGMAGKIPGGAIVQIVLKVLQVKNPTR